MLCKKSGSIKLPVEIIFCPISSFVYYIIIQPPSNIFLSNRTIAPTSVAVIGTTKLFLLQSAHIYYFYCETLRNKLFKIVSFSAYLHILLSVLYQISMTVSASSTQPNVPSVGSTSLLRIEVEQIDNENNDRWSGEFTSQCKDTNYRHY